MSSRQGAAAAEDLETTETDAHSAASMVIGADAKTEQAKAAVKTAQVNLEKTVIASPIDGVVIARNMDIGQTVSASFSAPTLFVIAADLSKLQVNANIDESDLGNVRCGSAGDVPGRRLSVGYVPRHRVAGAAQPDHRPERRDLLRRSSTRRIPR